VGKMMLEVELIFSKKWKLLCLDIMANHSSDFMGCEQNITGLLLYEALHY